MNASDDDDWGETMSNTPDKGPVDMIKIVWNKIFKAEKENERS